VTKQRAGIDLRAGLYHHALLVRHQPPTRPFGRVAHFTHSAFPERRRKKSWKSRRMDMLPMTVAGFAALEAELKRRQQEERPRIIQAIAEARSHGDLSENAEYHAAKESQSLNEGRIAELEDKISRADVIDVSKLSGNTIKFGATVTLIDEDTEAEKRYQIVGDSEAEVKAGKVSISSPISRALIGKKVGDAVEVNTPGGGKSYEIVKIDYI
jgi:transcription elongation factor GreA